MNEEKQKTDAESRLLHYLSQHKMRRTPERMMLLGQISEMKGTFTSATLLQSLAEKGFHLSQATVYNALRLFESAEIVRRRRSDNSIETYEYGLRDDEHLTLVCSRCGNSREIRDIELIKFLRLRRYPSFVMSGFDLYIHGLCSRCRGGGHRQKTNRKEKSYTLK